MLNSFLEMLMFEDGVLMGVACWLTIVCALALVGISIWLVIDIAKDCYCKWYVRVNTDKVDEKEVLATVVKKEYTPRRTAMVSAGKCLVPISQSATYNVCLSYNGEKFVFNCQKLYDQVKVNDKIPAKYLEYIAKNGEVIETELEIDS